MVFLLNYFLIVILDSNYISLIHSNDIMNGISSSSSGMAEYWTHLSYTRLTRIENFIQSIRSVMNDDWSEMIFTMRKERYHERSEITLNSYEQFKKYLKSYRLETLNQRIVLKELYSKTLSQINTNNNNDTQLMNNIHGFQAYNNRKF